MDPHSRAPKENTSHGNEVLVQQVWPKPFCKAQRKGEEDKADKGRGGKTTSGNGQAWSSEVPEGSGEQAKMEKTGCKIICGAPTTLVVK